MSEDAGTANRGQVGMLGLGVALHLILLVTAVHAWVVGWPGRVWVSLGVAGALAASAALFRRWPLVPVVAGGAALALLILVPAYFYGVDGSGLPIALVPLRIVVSLLFIGALGLAAWIFWSSLSSISLWGRSIPAALALFAATPVVMGLVEGIPFAEVMVGLWTWPYWTQGAWFGAAVLLPLAMIVALAGIFIPHLRPTRSSRGAHGVSTFGLFVLVLLTGMEMNSNGLANSLVVFGAGGAGSVEGTRYLARAPAMGDLELSAEPSRVLGDSTGIIEAVGGEALTRASPEAQQRVMEIFDRFERENSSLSTQSLSVKATQQRLGEDPIQLSTWVRDSTRWAPYAGVLRGPTGVLMERVGSNADRALLLSELLSEAGHRTRLARAVLSDKQSREMVETLLKSGSLPFPERMAQAALAPPGGARPPTSDETASLLNSVDEFQTEILATLTERVIDQTADLTRILAERMPLRGSGELSLPQSTLAKLSSYWWVQYRDGNQWTDLHLFPLQAIQDLGDVVPEKTFAPRSLPDSIFHQVRINVVVEQWSEASGLQEYVVLSHSFRAVDLTGSVLSFTHRPLHESDPSEPAPDQDPFEWYRGFLSDQTAWVPRLSHGSTTIEQRGFRASGEVIDNPSPAGSGGGRAKSSTPGGMFGGLSGGVAGGEGDRPEGSSAAELHLTAEWVEYGIQSPGHTPKTVRRQVFDLIGEGPRSLGEALLVEPTSAQGLERALALAGTRETLVETGNMTPEFALHSLSTAMLEQKAELGAEIASLAAVDTSFLDSALPIAVGRSPVFLYGFAMTRHEASPWRDVTFLAEPNLTSLVRRLRSDQASAFLEILELDVVSNRVEVSTGDPRRDFEARLGQGVMDTNLEALLLAGYGPVENTAMLHFASERLGVEWRTLASEDDPRLDRWAVPDDARARIKNSLAKGYVVAMPDRPVPMGDRTVYGWWRIDPRSGTALGIGSAGHGQSMTQRAINQAFISGPSIGLMLHTRSCQQRGNSEGLCDPCVLAFGGFVTGLWSIGTGMAVKLMADKFLGAAIGAGVGGYGIVTKLGSCIENLVSTTRGGYEGMGSK